MSKPNINIPAEFAVNGIKTDFDNSKLLDGFNRLNPDVLAGDNLNKFIDDTYKGLNGVLELYEGCILYDSTVAYNNTSIVFYINSDDEVEVYRSLINNNLNNPLTDDTAWEKVSMGGGGGLEIGDIGFTQMAIDESKGKRRILNGQLIIQDQYTSFTQIVKDSVALNPNLACTEQEWQTAVALSPNGTCDKFVIDDTAGTIRLPKYPTYLDLSINEPKAVMVYGDGNGLVLTDGTHTGTMIRGESNTTAPCYDVNYPIEVGTSVSRVAFDNTALGVTTNQTESGLTGNVTISSEQIKGTYFIQVATGVEESVDVTREIELNNPFCLLDYKYSEYELDNISWLRSNGQWNAKAVFPDVYDLLLKIYNGTETKAGVSVKLSTETYADTDFRLNLADETFMLPLKVALASGKAVVGNGMSLGFTTGSINSGVVYSGSGSNLFCGYTGVYGEPTGTTYTGSTTVGANKSIGLTTDATKSGIELSDANLYLYFYVGETVQNANLINAGRIEEELVNKLDIPVRYVVAKSDASLMPSWWIEYSDGWVEQGSVQSNMDSSGTGQRTISLLKEFADTNYSVQVSWTNAGTQSPSTAWTGCLRSRSVDGFVINKDNKTYITEYTWRAEGYKA